MLQAKLLSSCFFSNGERSTVSPPERFAGIAVEAQEHAAPALFFAGDDEHAVVPDDRRRMTTPGISTFHAMFCWLPSLPDHSKGTLVSLLVPSPRGPRNRASFRHAPVRWRKAKSRPQMNADGRK